MSTFLPHHGNMTAHNQFLFFFTTDYNYPIMMKLALIASTISAAAAFAPQPQAAARTSAVEATNPKASYQDTWAMDFAQEPGATAPVS